MSLGVQLRRRHWLLNALWGVVILLMAGTVAWLSTQVHYQTDWSTNGRNTLSKASVVVLDKMDGAIKITAYARDTALLYKRVVELVGRYQRHKPDVELEMTDPDSDIANVRALGIADNVTLRVAYQGQTALVTDITESGVTNVLQRLLRGGQREIVFLEGHGERDPNSQAGYDLSVWAGQLRQKGFVISKHNLLSGGVLPDKVAVLVVAGAQVSLLPNEAARLTQYLIQGGALLWMQDPGDLFGLEGMANVLGIDFVPGTVVDPNISQVGMQLFGTNDPRVALVADYGDHPVTQDFSYNSLFPIAAAVTVNAQPGWVSTPLLMTMSNTWSEVSEMKGKFGFDEGLDVLGPLTIAQAMSRTVSVEMISDGTGIVGQDQVQRVVVVGDGDFLSNVFIGAGGNQQLGMNMINWLSGDEQLIDVPVKLSIDLSLNLTEIEMMVIGFGLLLVLPLLLLSAGGWVWWRRR